MVIHSVIFRVNVKSIQKYSLHIHIPRPAFFLHSELLTVVILPSSVVFLHTYTLVIWVGFIIPWNHTVYISYTFFHALENFSYLCITYFFFSSIYKYTIMYFFPYWWSHRLLQYFTVLGGLEKYRIFWFIFCVIISAKPFVKV